MAEAVKYTQHTQFSPHFFPPQSYGVCVLGLKTLWLLIVVYGLSCSVFSSLSLCLLRLPRWVCLVAGAVVHGVLLVVLLALSMRPNQPQYLIPLLAISVLWGLGTALNKTGVSSEWWSFPHAVQTDFMLLDISMNSSLCVCVLALLGMLYAEEKERLDFVFTIYHWCQAIAIFIVYLWSNWPMRVCVFIVVSSIYPGLHMPVQKLVDVG